MHSGSSADPGKTGPDCEDSDRQSHSSCNSGGAFVACVTGSAGLSSSWGSLSGNLSFGAIPRSADGKRLQ